VFGFQGRMLWD